jgi:RNA polymerase sigma-70 factor (ECF subfamily)
MAVDEPDRAVPDKLNPAEISALYVDHGEQLRRFLIGVLRDSQLAHDALQATFAKAVQQGHTAREETRKAWLFRVAYHEAMALKRRQGVDARAMQKVAWSREEGTKAADEPMIRFETVNTVREAIAELPAAQQQVLRMRIYEEKTFAVIAAELNIPLGTALARMRAAMEKLRKRLADQHGND